MSVPTYKLNSGYEMPAVGLGLWKVDGPISADLVVMAVKEGYRMFDDAAIYGNEKEVGEGLCRAIKEGLVKRSELFVVSKLWCTFHDPEHVGEGLARTLSDLQLDYVDMYYMHFPFPMGYVDPRRIYPCDWADEYTPGTATIEQTWHTMEELNKKGLARSIGVSNFNGQTLYDLLRYAKIKPAALQIEHHPYLVQPALIKAAKAADLQIVAYSSFGPMSFIELGLDRAKDITPLFEVALIKEIAKKHGKTPAQVLLRWSTQRGLAVIPKSSSRARLAENLSHTSFDLTEDEIKSISGLDKGLRFNDPLDDDVNIPVFA